MKQHFLARMRAALDAIEQNALADLALFEYVDLLTAQADVLAAPRTLFTAAAAGDVHTTRALLRKPGVDVDADDGTGITAMYFAAAHGHAAVVEVLADEGHADLSKGTRVTHPRDSTLRLVESWKDNPALISIGGAECNIARLVHHLVPPIYIAARNGRVDTVRALLQRGANVDQATSRGETPLIGASWDERTEVITVLLDHGAEVNTADVSNQTSLFVASVKGHAEALKVLIDRGGDLNQAFVHPDGFTIRPEFHYDESTDTPISAASYIGHTEVVKILLAAGADALRAGGYHGTPFLDAAGEGHSEIITLLLDRGGVDINQVVGEDHEEQPGSTALLLASLEGREETIKVLIKRGADVNKASTCGETPVAAASTGGHADAVHVLLKAGADANAADNEGYTALIGAAEGGCLEVIRVLAEVWPTNPLAWRMFLMGGGAASELQDYLAPPANRTTRNHLPRLYSKPDMMKEIYKYLYKPRYADLNQTDEDGRTALQIAELLGQEEVAELLRGLSLG